MSKLTRDSFKNPIANYFSMLGKLDDVTRVKIIENKCWSEESVLIRTSIGEFLISLRSMKSNVVITLRDISTKEVTSLTIPYSTEIEILPKSLKYDSREVIMVYSVDNLQTYLIDAYSLTITEAKDFICPVSDGSYISIDLENEIIKLREDKFGSIREVEVSFKKITAVQLQSFVPTAISCMINNVEVKFI